MSRPTIRFEHGGGTLVDEQLGTGTGLHVVFLHGWRLNRESLRGIGVLFAHTHAVHLIDLPGFGDAPAPPSDWDTVKYADLVQHYLSDRIAGPVVLVGHSFGGRVAVRLAARRPPHIQGLVLMAVPGLPLTRSLGVRLRRSGIRLLRTVLRAVQPVTGPAPLTWHTRRFGSTDYLAAGELRPLLVRTVSEDLSDCARSVACPTLLLWGTEDTESPLALAEGYRALMNGRATVEILPHKDHHLYSGTGAHLCGFKIRTWLEAHVER